MAEQPSERERFERWYCEDAQKQGVEIEDISHLREPDGGYGSHRHMLNGKWQGWQARAALSHPSTAWTHEINQELDRQYLKGFQAGKAFEREQCALVCDEIDDQDYSTPATAARAIRSRKDAP